MPSSKAQQKAVNKYMKENYDRFLTTFKPKGRLDTIKAHAAAQGESVNGFINRAINQTMERDTAGSPQEIDSILTPATLGTAQEAVKLTGETVPAFLERTAEVQAERDKHTRGMADKIAGINRSKKGGEPNE